MSFNPFIYDSSFRGSPILSYGKASSGTIWPKILAILAGILVVLGLVFTIWLWFFSQVPIPKKTAVQIILPAGQKLTTKAPLEWKQIQELNKPMPTLAGMVNRDDGNGFEAYAIRLSFFDALFTNDKVWQIRTDAIIADMDYQTPYMIFGWPWELFNQEIWLSIDVKQIFSFRNIAMDDLPHKISGRITANEWQTDFSIVEDFDSLDFAQSNNKLHNFAVLSSINDTALLNYYAYQGLKIDLNGEYSLVDWSYTPYSLNSLLLEQDSNQFITASSTDILDRTKKVEFVLPDGEKVKRIYSTEELATSTSVLERVTSTDIIYAESMQIDNSVSDLTCTGKVMARLNSDSIQNLCSWIDICFVAWNELMFVNRNDRLVVCGY